MAEPLIHGGTDALGVPAHDFSTNRNACGPCPAVVAALQAAHVAQYPDPAYTELRAALAAFHGVSPQQVVLAGSASEFIHRITMHAARSGAHHISLSQHSYGDYPHAARLWGLAAVPRATHAGGPGLHWACAPSSPLGRAEDVGPLWQHPAPAGAWRVLDCAYAPLQLERGFGPLPPLRASAYASERASTSRAAGAADFPPLPQGERGEQPAMLAACAHTDGWRDVWQLWTPNKALGMTGVRAAYAIASASVSAQEVEALRALAPSWVVGAHGVAMLHAWVQPQVQDWLAASLQQLRLWKARQLALCGNWGWQVQPGHLANYFVARLPLAEGAALGRLLLQLREQGVKLRDCASFGLPGHVRLGVLPPASQQALARAWMGVNLKDFG